MDCENRQDKLTDEQITDNLCSQEQDDNIGSKTVMNGMLDIIYGVLFDPVRTFAKFATEPPLVAAVIIFITLNLAEALMGLFIPSQYIEAMNFVESPEMLIQLILQLKAAGGFVLGVITWFFMAGLLHLLAELFGGKGKARQVFAVYAVAGLPAVFMFPVNLLMVFGYMGSLYLGLTLFVWSVVLLTIGVREVHQFSTGKALLTVLMPSLVLIVLVVLGLVFIGSNVLSIKESIL